MDSTVVIGGQWGDEGKGKVVDALAPRHDWVIRYQGGANAGHTLVVDGERIVLHLLPAGTLHRGVRCLLGGGMVIDPWALRDEILAIEKRDPSVRERLRVAATAHLLLPHHRSMDEHSESQRKRRSIGTTGRGIGPAYMDKAGRSGLRAGDLLLPAENLERKVIARVLEANEVLAARFGAEPLPARKIAQELVQLARMLGPLVVEPFPALAGVRARSESALLEGAQGALLDLDHGTYPYVTSSNPTVGGALTGTGLPPRCLGEILGVYKAYCTRVGNGPFPSELLADEADTLRTLGGEFGATTGRARRCGWFDLPAARYTREINGLTGAVVTKLDVLDTLPELKVAVAYETDDGVLEHFPVREEVLDRCRPRYRTFPGWERPTRECRSLRDLPSRARQYLEFLEEGLGVHVVGISVGPGREDVIWTPEGVTT